MGKSEQFANKINEDIKAGKSINQIKADHQIDENSWQRYSAKAYALNLVNEKKKRLVDEQKINVSTTSSKDIDKIIVLNTRLVDFAIILPVTSTIGELSLAAELANLLPTSENELLLLIERLTMQPLHRARQKKGRFETFPYFNSVFKLIDAATLCYYRKNYISCYLTLVPVVEGIMLRWLEYDGTADKPEFEKLRRFFNNGYTRQPMPWNIQFHEIFSKGCAELIEQHFFKSTETGNAHNFFNRHLAAHLLHDGDFATKDNCLRLFMVLDAMSEIYLYESRGSDPRFSLHHSETESIVLFFNDLINNSASSSDSDILY